MAEPNYQDFLRVVITRINDWAMTGNFLPLLDMFHREGRIQIDGAYGLHRLDTRSEMEEFLRNNRPGQTMMHTYESEMPIGAFASFRWNYQPEDNEAGNLVTDMLDGKILRLLWEFMPTTKHPMAFTEAGHKPVIYAEPEKIPGRPAIAPKTIQPGGMFKPMPTGGAGLSTAAPAAPPPPAASPSSPVPAAPPSAPAPAAPTKPVFL